MGHQTFSTSCKKEHYHMDKAYFIELPECQESDILLNHPLSAHQFF
nr:hypothetical protein [Bacteroides intestinalis]